jgi:hypothetical protein
MRHLRDFAVLVAIAAAALPACSRDAMLVANGDASVGDLPEAGRSQDGDAPGEAVASLELDRSAVDLGAPDVNGTGVAAVIVTNTGNATSGPMTITASAGVATKGCSGALLLAGASCTITITATPTAAGLFTGTVWIAADPGAVPPLQVSVSAIVYTDSFSVSPGAIDLGNVTVGVLTKQTITVTARMPISDLTVASSGPDVSIDKAASTCTTVLLADASCTVVVSFLASAAGSRTDAIVLSGGGAAGKTVTVAITAVAQKPAQLVISPSTTQNFAATVGQTSSAITFGVANAGDLATGEIAVTVTGPNAADFNATTTCLVLAPLSGCTVAVTWTPSTIVPPNESADLTVTDTAVGGTSVTVALVGICYGACGARLVITPLSGDLGPVLVGATGPATVFTVTSTPDTASGNLAVGVSSSEFVITDDTCTGISLAARTGTCTISIALRPATAGAKTAVLTVTGANGTPDVKILTGTGIIP